MKTCIHCGAQMDDTSNFCPNCGTRCNDQNDMERSVYQPYEEPRESVPEVRAEQYPMKWHKFLMVVMIISAVFTIINGISFIAGFEYSEYQFTKYGANASMVYNAFPGLKTCDTFYGVETVPYERSGLFKDHVCPFDWRLHNLSDLGFRRNQNQPAQRRQSGFARDFRSAPGHQQRILLQAQCTVCELTPSGN